MASHEIGETTLADYAVRVLRSPTGLEAAFAPGVGMIGCSLRHRGEELLGQRGGLAKYAEAGSTFGIPLLHPWANRLGGLEILGGRLHMGNDLQIDAGLVHLGDAQRPQIRKPAA